MTSLRARLTEHYAHFFSYAVIGVSGVTIDYALYALLCHPIGYQPANAISITCGLTNNFFWNSRYNFRVNDRLFLRFLSFYGVGLLGWLISAGLLYIFIDQWHYTRMAGKAFTLLIVPPLQYSLNKVISFRTSSTFQVQRSTSIGDTTESQHVEL